MHRIKKKVYSNLFILVQNAGNQSQQRSESDQEKNVDLKKKEHILGHIHKNEYTLTYYGQSFEKKGCQSRIVYPLKLSVKSVGVIKKL
jgi:adenylate kinase